MGAPQRVSIAGVEVRCSHCDSREFLERKGLITTRGLAYLDLEWPNRSARVLQCSSCGHLEWFARLEPVDEDDTDDTPEEDIECLSCGRAIPAGVMSCRHCGWSYE
ncbi:hypothetical protein [Nocardia sp. BMG111209]|uniref:hypothetical protein n=1 Tax=Nocardia sp. BMG111209 TaxID=1160137 RepID=UPI00039995B9|nr:hypothetical protein [Nocardia sp. BMG111209]